MTRDIQYMLERFPIYAHQIRKAYESNEDFRSLCEDFYSSSLIVQSMQRKMINDRKTDLEYQKLFLDLESEILSFLGAF